MCSVLLTTLQQHDDSNLFPSKYSKGCWSFLVSKCRSSFEGFMVSLESHTPQIVQRRVDATEPAPDQVQIIRTLTRTPAFVCFITDFLVFQILGCTSISSLGFSSSQNKLFKGFFIISFAREL